MSDMAEVSRIAGALAVHVDARNWKALLQLFGPEVRVDYTALFGGDVQVIEREQLIAQWQGLLPGFTHTTHVIGTPLIEIDGERAALQASVVAWHFVDDADLVENDVWQVGGCYEMVLDKNEPGWQITALTLARPWQRGNLELPKLASLRSQQVRP